MSLSGLIRSRCNLKIAGFVLALAELLMLPGCWVTSINPLYEDVTPKDSDIVFENILIGSWTFTDDKCTTILTITAKDEVYDLRSVQGKECNDPEEKSHRQARLVKLDTYHFLDISPMSGDVCDMCLALHWIFLTKFDKDTLALTPIEWEGLKKLLRAGVVDLKTLPEDPKPRIIEGPTTLTALTKDLKRFCRRFAADKTVFRPDSTIMFKRT